MEGSERRGRTALAFTFWRRASWLAHRMLSDVDEVPWRIVRHSLRWRGSDLSASRKRDRAIRRRDLQAICPVLGAHRVPACRRREDVEVQRELLYRAPAYRAGPRSFGYPILAYVGAVSDTTQLYAGWFARR